MNGTLAATPSWTSRPSGSARRRARAAVGRGRARLRDVREVLRLLHGQRRRHPDRGVHALARPRPRPRIPPRRRTVLTIEHSSESEPQRRPAALRAGRLPVGHDRRRRRQDNQHDNAQNRGTLLGKILRIDPDPPGVGGRRACRFPHALRRPATRPRRPSGPACPRRQRVLRPAWRGRLRALQRGVHRFGWRNPARGRPQAASAARHRRGQGRAAQAVHAAAQEALDTRSCVARSARGGARGCGSGCAPAMPRATAQPWSVARFACAARRRSRKRRSTGLVASSRARA